MDPGLKKLILDDIVTCARIVKDPAGRSMSVIAEADAAAIAKNFHCLLIDVYMIAMASGIWPFRYLRNHSCLKLQEQLTLARSRVAVIGCGGLGGYVVLMLARMGIGSLTVVDPDVFDETNLNRQAFAFSDTLGKQKIDVAVATVKSINPAVHVKGYPDALNSANAGEILKGTHVVVDALDNLPDRDILLQVTRKMRIPLVHAAIVGFEGQVMTFQADDRNDYDIFRDDRGAFPGSHKNAESMLGIPSITPAFIASLQAMEVVKILLKRGNPRERKMLYADMEIGEFNYFDLSI